MRSLLAQLTSELNHWIHKLTLSWWLDWWLNPEDRPY
jgi:hypothetical protein